MISCQCEGSSYSAHAIRNVYYHQRWTPTIHTPQPLQVFAMRFLISDSSIKDSPLKTSFTALSTVCAFAKAFLFFSIVFFALIQARFRINCAFFLQTVVPPWLLQVWYSVVLSSCRSWTHQIIQTTVFWQVQLTLTSLMCSRAVKFCWIDLPCGIHLP